jgi:hypothetical protein
MTWYITLVYDSVSGRYDVYLYTPSFSNTPYSCLVHNGTRYELRFDSYTYLIAGYLQLAENDVMELHAVDGMGTGDYHKATYTATGGTLAEDSHGITTALNVIEVV